MTDNPSSTHQRYAKDVIIVGLATGLVALSSILVVPLLTRTLGATDYGIWAQSLATIGVVLIVVGLGLSYPMVRFLPAKTDKCAIKDDVYSVLWLSFLVTLIVSIVMVIFAGPIARTFFDGATPIVRLTAVVILVSSPTTIYLTFFRAFTQMRTYSLFVVADAYGQVGIMAYLVLHGYGLEEILIGLVSLKTLLLTCMLIVAARQIGVTCPRFLRTKEYLRLALPAFPSGPVLVGSLLQRQVRHREISGAGFCRYLFRCIQHREHYRPRTNCPRPSINADVVPTLRLREDG